MFNGAYFNALWTPVLFVWDSFALCITILPVTFKFDLSTLETVSYYTGNINIEDNKTNVNYNKLG